MARRRYQNGSLVQKNKKWIGRWREDVIRPDGSLHRVSRKEILGTLSEYPTKRLAQRALEQRLSVVNSPTYRARPTATFEEFSNRWVATVLSQHKPSTQSSTKSYLRKYLIPAFGKSSMMEINGEMLQAFVSRTQVAPKTMRNLVVTMRMMWNSAKAWGYVAHNPFDGLVLPKRGRVEVRHFTIEEMQKIIAEAEEPYRSFFWLAAETGLRAGELTGLTVEDVDLEQRVVRVRQSVWRGGVQTPKTANAIRAFAISEELASSLSRVLSERSNDSVRLLWRTSRGTPWDSNLVVKRKLHPLLTKLGIERAGPTPSATETPR